MIYARKTFSIPVYTSKVTVLVVDNCVTEYNKLLKKLPTPVAQQEPDPMVLAYAVWFDEKIGTYYLLFSTRKPIGPSIIAHECFHLALAICEHFGVEIAADAEAPAYLFEHLFQQVAQYLLGTLNDQDLKLQIQVRKSRRSSREDVQLG